MPIDNPSADEPTQASSEYTPNLKDSRTLEQLEGELARRMKSVEVSGDEHADESGKIQSLERLIAEKKGALTPQPQVETRPDWKSAPPAVSIFEKMRAARKNNNQSRSDSV